MVYELKMKCEVYKIVTVEAGSEEEAINNPWYNAIDETETDQINLDIISCKEVK